MKGRIYRISPEVQAQIIKDYGMKLRNQRFKYSLRQIAEKHEISLSAVNGLIRKAKCSGRKRGCPVQLVPSARVMKILRDASEPFASYEKVGERNPRVVVRNGKSISIPLSKQRVASIIKRWKNKVKASALHSKGFNPGDRIRWAGQDYIVLRYDSSHQGAVIDLSDRGVIDPFSWVYDNSRSELVAKGEEGMTQKQVRQKYLSRDGNNTKPNPGSANGASNQ